MSKVNRSMKKADAITLIAEEFETSKVNATEIYNKFFAVVENALVQEGSFPLDKLGSLSVQTRASRKGRNPQTGEELTIPERQVIAYKRSEHAKRIV